MEALRILEEKIVTLVALVQDLRSKNSALEAQVTSLQKQSDELTTQKEQLEADVARLTEDNFQLVANLGNLETSVSTGSETISLLSEEKALTKIAVDDLIKSISVLVEAEQQQ